MKLGTMDAQNYDDVYWIGLLNDGNKDILIKSVSRTIYMVSSAVKDEDVVQGVLATVQPEADGPPRCRSKPAGRVFLQSYEHDGNPAKQGPVVVQAGQFFTMDRMRFAPYPVSTDLVAKGESVQLLTCFYIEYVKPDGTEDGRSIAVGTLTAKRSSDATALLVNNGQTTLSKLRSVDH